LKASKAAGIVLVGLLLSLIAPGLALAAECTDTWIGPAAGEWQLPEDWSTGLVPTATDVVCIPLGKKVELTTEASASLVQGEGQLTIAAGFLAIGSTAEQSNIGTLKMTGGALKGGNELRVLNSLVAEGGTMEGAGSTILGKEATGRVEPLAEGAGLHLLGKRILLVNGRLVVDSEAKLRTAEGSLIDNVGTLEVEGPKGEVLLEGTELVNSGTFELEGTESRMWADEGAALTNSGTFVANGEGEGKGLVAGPGAVPTVLNTGAFLKDQGEELETEVAYVFDNENLVESKSGTLDFSAGGESGREHADSWVTSGLNSQIHLARGGYDLGAVAMMEGEIGFYNGATVHARELAAPTGNLYVVESTFETVSSAAPVEILYLETVRGTVKHVAGGQMALERFRDVAGGFNVGAGASLQVAAGAEFSEASVFKLEEGAEAEFERLENGEGAVLVEPTASIVASSANLGAGLNRFAENASLHVQALTIGGETTFGKSDSVEATGPILTAGLVLFSESMTVPCERLEVEEGGVVELGKSVHLEAADAVSLRHGGALLISETASAAAENTTIEEGLLTGPGPYETDHLMWEGGEMSGNGRTVVKESGTIWFATAVEKLDERALVLDKEFSLGNSTLLMSNGASVRNLGEFDASSEATAFGPQVQVDPASTKPPHIFNFGHLEKTTGEGTTYVTAPVRNYGVVGERTGRLSFGLAEALPSDQQVERHGSESSCGDPVNCATGNFSEEQTDIAVPGLGIGLDLSRTYSSQAAAAATSPGIFGYGWSSSFADHLQIEGGGAEITFVRGDGSTVPFAETATGGYEAEAWSQAKLSGSTEAGYVLTLPDRTKFVFSTGGLLQSVTDRNGNETTLSYEAGRLKTITDPSGRKITLAYNGEGLLESAQDPMGHTVKYAYEGKELASVTMPGEATPRWRFEYDGSHRMTAMIDGRGGETKNEYDEANRVVSQSDPAGRTLDFEYDGFHTTVTDVTTGAITDEWFTSFNEPFKITYGFGTAAATTSESTYNERGELTASADGNGHTTEFDYDAEGNRTSLVNAAGDETTWTYNAAHEVLTETTPNGETTTIERDAAGNPETISRPAPGESTQTTSYVYDAHGQPETMTDPLGHAWKYEYDPAGDLVGETDPEGDKRTSAYNENSQLTSMVSPKGNEEGAEATKYTTSYERDAQGRLIKVTDPLGHSTEFVYDANGNLEKQTDANGHTTTYTYNADNQSTKVKRPDGSIAETEYDGAGQVKAQIDGLGHKTEYVRNVLEEPVEVIDPLGRKTTEEYDGAGNVISRTDPSKRTTSLGYDAANRLKEVSYSDGKTPTAKLSYDKDGNLVGMSDGTGETTYEYDQLSRLTHTKDGHGDAVSYAYDLMGQQTGITYPNGKSVTQGFDKAGRLKSVADWLGHTTAFGYDRNSNLVSTAFPEGTGNLDEYGFDRADWMAEVKMKKGSETLASLVYSRDKLGQVESLAAKGLPGAESEVLGYDANSRLTKAGAESFEYDAAGNLTKAPGTTNVFDKASELEKGTSATYTYDEEGERTKTTPAAGEVPVFDLAFGNESTGPGHLSAPAGVATDSEGNAWVADTAHNRIQEFNSKGELLRAFGAVGSANGELRSPRGVAIDSKGNLWVADTGNSRVQEFNSKGEFIRKFGSEGTGTGQFRGLQDLTVDPEGHVWTLEGGSKFLADNRVQEFSSEGTYITGFGSFGSENGQLNSAKGIATDSKGNVWVADTGNNRIQEFKPSGEFIRKFGSEGTGNGQFKAPQDLAFDAEGKLWVADTGNGRFQRFTSEGGYLASFGANGPNAGQFLEPQALAIDAEGNIWIADTGNNRVQESSSSEFIRQFGGESSGPGQLASPGGLATDSEGDVWVADTAHNRIQEFNGKGEFVRQFGVLGSANGEFSSPRAIAVNQTSGNLFVADFGNNRVQEFNSKGEFIRKWGAEGTGNGQFKALQGVAIDPEGHIWTIEGGGFLGNNRVQEFTAEGAYITQFGKEGTEAGQFKHPEAIATDAEGHIWVADTENNRIQEFKPSGEFIRKFGSEGTGNGQLKSPAGIAIDSEGKVWVSDTGNDRIQRLSATGTYLSQFGTPGPNPGQFSEPRGVAIDGKGNLWIADTGNNRVQESTATEFLRQFGGGASGPGHLSAPAGVATDSEGNVWVADTSHNRIQEFDSEGSFIRQFGAPGTANGELRSPRGVAVDSKGNLYVADAGNSRVQEFNSKGEFVRKWGTEGSGNGQFRGLQDLAVDPEGHIWTLEGGSKLLANNRIQAFSSEGTYITGFGSFGSENGQLNSAKGITTDSKGNVWVADTGNNRIQGLKPSGEFVRKFGSEGSGTGQFKGPQGLAFDSEGKLWVADGGNDRFQRFTSEGTYLAQFGAPGPNAGQFSEPQALAIDAKGSFWVADAGNDRVQKWLASSPPTTYSYDQAGNLLAVERAKVGETPAVSETYTYNGTGLRASQTVPGTTSYLTWNTSAGLPLLLNDGQANYIYGPNGLPIEQISAAGTPTYYHHDQLGSTRMLTSSSGTPTGTFTYSAYGSPAGRTGTQTTPLGYAGQYTNAESGLQYLRARSYDPVTGQFMSRDPLAALTGAPYSYAMNNPASGSDPSGLCNMNIFSGSFWTEGNCISESPLNPLPYYKAEINSIENGCSYWDSVQHGLKGAGVLTFDTALLATGAEAAAAAGDTSAEITGFTSHGLEQVLARDGVGVSDQALQDAVSSPLEVIPQADGAVKYVGQDATVVLNEDGEVITAWANNKAGWRQRP
jgi:RHS repeat-associated protein